jgi:hypothetical protein
MARLDNKLQRIFAEDSSYIAQFGSLKAGSKASSTDLDTLQSLAAWAAGWAGAIDGAPALEDWDSFFYVLTKQLRYLQQTGISEWLATPTYYTGSMVNNGVDTIFISGTDANINNALTDGANWINGISRKVTTVSSLNYTVVNNDSFIISSSTPTTTNKNIILPAPSAGNLGRQIVIKQTGVISGFNLAVIVDGGSTIDGSSTSAIAQYVTKKFVSDGSNWFVN